MFDFIKRKRAEIKAESIERSKRNTEALKVELKELEAKNAIKREELHLKAEVAKARGPSIGQRIFNRLEHNMQHKKTQGINFNSSSNPFLSGNGPDKGFLNSLQSSNPNPFYSTSIRKPQQTRPRGAVATYNALLKKGVKPTTAYRRVLKKLRNN